MRSAQNCARTCLGLNLKPYEGGVARAAASFSGKAQVQASGKTGTQNQALRRSPGAVCSTVTGTTRRSARTKHDGRNGSGHCRNTCGGSNDAGQGRRGGRGLQPSLEFLGHGARKAAQGLADRFAQFREAARPEQHEGHNENHQEFGGS